MASAVLGVEANVYMNVGAPDKSPGCSQRCFEKRPNVFRVNVFRVSSRPVV